MKDLGNVKMADLLPDSIANDKAIKASGEALDPLLRAVFTNSDLPILMAKIDVLTSGQLDHLATQVDVTTWRDLWPVSLKRSVLKAAIATKRKMGTVAAVRDVLASIGSAAQIVEWWQMEPKGEPHTFQIVATLSEIEGTLTDEMQDDLIYMINDAKPARSHYTFILNTSSSGAFGISGYLRTMTTARISDIS